MYKRVILKSVQIKCKRTKCNWCVCMTYRVERRNGVEIRFDGNEDTDEDGERCVSSGSQ